MTLSMIAAVIGILVCMRGLYRCGVMAGFEDGLETGSSVVLRDMCEGRVYLEDGVLHVSDDAAFKFCNEHGDTIGEIEVDNLSFEED